MSVDLSDRIVLITGGGTGIGRELALAFGRAGCRLALTYYEHRAGAEETAQLCRALGAPDVLTLPLQIADDDSIRALVEDVVGHYGGVDILVQNAGTIDWRRFLDQDFWSIDNQLAVNLGGVMKLTWAILPMVRDTVIAIGSTAALHDSRTPPTYCATKWGLRGFMKAMALERPGKRFVLRAPHGDGDAHERDGRHASRARRGDRGARRRTRPRGAFGRRGGHARLRGGVRLAPGPPRAE